MDIDAHPITQKSALTYLEDQEAQSSDELRPQWTKLRTLFEKKLWHNLTLALYDFVFLPGTGPFLVDLYQKFIIAIDSKINVLSLVEITRRIGREFSEPEQTLSFLNTVHSRLASPYSTPATESKPEVPAPPKPAPEAYALSLSSIGYAQLLLGDLPACKKALDECEKILGEQDSVDPVVNAGFYGVAGDYYKVKAEYAPYYKNALLYLACIREKELSDTEKKARAHDLCIAALLGDTIYNFGELLQHPILQTLVGTEHEWIKSLISAFNSGEIGKFESLANHFPSEPILESSDPFLRQKICLMALIQTAFARPRNGASRMMTFQSIAEATRLPVHEVEHLLMKALSLKLIRGLLDQVDSTVDITWVQPRVLDTNQLETLASQIGQWTNSVGETGMSVDALKAKAAVAPLV